MKKEPYKLPELQQRFDTETYEKRLKKVQSMSTLNSVGQHLTARDKHARSLMTHRKSTEADLQSSSTKNLIEIARKVQA